MFVVLCNVPPADEARISEALVGRGLAACVNALPAGMSTYVWEGAVVRETEVTLLIKVAAERVDALAEALRAGLALSSPALAEYGARAAELLAPYRPDAVRATLAERVLPVLGLEVP